MTRHVFLVGFVMLAAFGPHARLQAQSTPRQRLTRAELEAGGWTRLSELVFAARGVPRTTVDGITVIGGMDALPASTLAPSSDAWRVLVDGQPVPAAFAGATLLDLLPVDLSQLDSVVVRRAPVLAAGRLATRGTIELHTRRAAPGAHGLVAIASGNEAGDPGPLAFTPEATPNVDNSGPFVRARATWGAPRWDADVAVRRWTDNLTDQRLASRHARAAGARAPELWVRHLAPSLRLGADALGGRHGLQAGVAQLRGTWFVPAAREDESLAIRLAFAGLHGELGGGSTGGMRGARDSAAAPSATRVGYRLSVSRLEARPYGAPLPSHLEHGRREIAGALTATRAVGGVDVTVDASATRRSLLDAPHAALAPRHVDQLDVALALRSGADDPLLAVVLGRGLAGMRWAATAAHAIPLGAATWLHLDAAADAGARGDDGAFIDLQLMGLGAYEEQRRGMHSLGIALARARGDGMRASVGAAARRRSGLDLVLPDAQPRLPYLEPRTVVALELGTAELHAGVETGPGRIQGGATYRLATTIGGDTLIRNAARSVPRHLLDASVVAAPAPDIRVRAAAHVASRTQWYVAPGATSDAVVPAVTRLDLSIEKWLLAGRVRGQVLARNLLNDVERYHPLGADFRLRVFASVTATF